MDVSKKLRLINMLPRSWADKIIKNSVDKYCDKYANVKIEGYENIKNLQAPVIFISNHLSNADGVFLNRILKEHHPIFVAGEKLSKNEFTSSVLRVVDCILIKPNSADKEAIEAVIKALKSGKNIMIFPEGTRSRTGKMIEAKKGLILIAKLSKAKIVPIGITGTEKFLPINDVDMGQERIHNADITINIGKPMDLPKKEKEEGKNEYHDRAVNEIMTEIAKLLPKEYRGVYDFE